MSKLRRATYRAGSALGDIEALASGDPQKIAGRWWRKMLWRCIGRATR